MGADRVSDEERKREKLLSGKWFVLGPPWGEGAIVLAGSEDPHAGVAIADCDPMFAEDERAPCGLDVADRIVADHNEVAALRAAAVALRAERDALRVREAELLEFVRTVKCCRSDSNLSECLTVRAAKKILAIDITPTEGQANPPTAGAPEKTDAE